jgi:DNA-binding NarL/FixJ family response regulator
MDGIDAAQHIRARAPISVISLSAYTDMPTVARTWQTAPAGYLVKPVPDHPLPSTLARALDGPSPPGQELL